MIEQLGEREVDKIMCLRKYIREAIREYEEDKERTLSDQEKELIEYGYIQRGFDIAMQNQKGTAAQEVQTLRLD